MQHITKNLDIQMIFIVRSIVRPLRTRLFTYPSYFPHTKYTFNNYSLRNPVFESLLPFSIYLFFSNPTPPPPRILGPSNEGSSNTIWPHSNTLPVLNLGAVAERRPWNACQELSSSAPHSLSTDKQSNQLFAIVPTHSKPPSTDTIPRYTSK